MKMILITGWYAYRGFGKPSGGAFSPDQIAQHFGASLAAKRRGAGRRQAIERTVDRMLRSYSEPLTIGQLAGEAWMNCWQLGAAFKRFTGKTPADYLTEVRIERAKQLILQSSFRFRDIALQIGFRDEYYYSRRFRQLTGFVSIPT